MGMISLIIGVFWIVCGLTNFICSFSVDEAIVKYICSFNELINYEFIMKSYPAISFTVHMIIFIIPGLLLACVGRYLIYKIPHSKEDIHTHKCNCDH
jgi:hypothetical protein